MPTKIDGIKEKADQIFGHSAVGDPAIVGFYTEWSHYLAPINSIAAEIINWIASGIMIGLFKVSLAMEQIFNLSFKVIGIAGTATNKSSIVYTFFHGFQILGTAIAGLIFVFLMIKNAAKSETKYKNYLVNIAFVLLCTAVIPWGVNTISSATTKTVDAITQVDNSGAKVSSLSAQPIIDNTVDMVVIANNGFGYKLDSNGLIKTATGKQGELNKLSSNSDILNTDFSETLGPTNGEMIKTLNKNQKGAGDIFTHELDTSDENPDGSTNKVVMNIKDHTIVKANNAFEHLYSRFRINWFGVYAQLLILIVMFTTMSIRVVKSSYDVITLMIIAPYVGLRSVSSTRKYKELLSSIEGAFASMIMNIVVLKIMYLIMMSAPQLVSGADLGALTRVMFNIVIYLGAFFGAFQGIGYIEKFTGVSQGHSETTQQLLGAAGLGMAAGAGATSAAKGAFSGVSRAGSSAKGLASSIKDGTAAQKAGQVANAIAHPVQTAKAGLNGAKENAQQALVSNKDGFAKGFGGNNGKPDTNLNTESGESGQKNGLSNSNDSDQSNPASPDKSDKSDNSKGTSGQSSSNTNGLSTDEDSNNPENPKESNADANGLPINGDGDGSSNSQEDPKESNADANGLSTDSDEDSNDPEDPKESNADANGLSTDSDEDSNDPEDPKESNADANGLSTDSNEGSDNQEDPKESNADANGLSTDGAKGSNNQEDPKEPNGTTTKNESGNDQSDRNLENEQSNSMSNPEGIAPDENQDNSNNIEQPHTESGGFDKQDDSPAQDSDSKGSIDSPTKSTRSNNTHFSPYHPQATGRASQSMNQIINASQKSHINGPEIDDDNE